MEIVTVMTQPLRRKNSPWNSLELISRRNLVGPPRGPWFGVHGGLQMWCFSCDTLDIHTQWLQVACVIPSAKKPSRVTVCKRLELALTSDYSNHLSGRFHVKHCIGILSIHCRSQFCPCTCDSSVDLSGAAAVRVETTAAPLVSAWGASVVFILLRKLLRSSEDVWPDHVERLQSYFFYLP